MDGHVNTHTHTHIHALNYRPKKETDKYTKTDRDGNSTDRWTCEQRERKYTHTHTLKDICKKGNRHTYTDINVFGHTNGRIQNQHIDRQTNTYSKAICME